VTYFDDGHVDGVSIRLWTAATNETILHPPGKKWTWSTMVHDTDWGKLPIRLPEPSVEILAAELSSSKLGESGRRKWLILSTKYCFHTCRVPLHAIKSYDMSFRLYYSPKEERCGFLSPLKIHRLGRLRTSEPCVQPKISYENLFPVVIFAIFLNNIYPFPGYWYVTW
jgi:hypothetical protein